MNRNNRIIVIGNSRSPFGDKVDRKELLRFFGSANGGRMLYCPCPNYPTRLKLWRHFLAATGLNLAQLDRATTGLLLTSSSSMAGSSHADKFDLTTLAYISEGYSAGNMQQAVQATF